MQTAGIICEYNPFHLGHLRQLQLVRAQLGEDAAIVCLMSGNYVQRGEPAIFDKCVRARAAAEAGADLVLELPVTAVLRSAEGFAAEGVRILSAIGCGYLSFGCESGDGAAIWRVAEASVGEGYEALLHEQIRQGSSYAAARQQAMQQLGWGAELLERPNDILAVEYCRAILRQGSAMQPLAVLRPGDYHEKTPDPQNPSATAVRNTMLAGGSWRQLVPEACCYKDAAPHALGWGERAMLARLRGLEKQDWARAAHGSEGLWSKVWRAVQTQPDYESILAAAKSRRYPRTRLQRLLLCAYLGIDAGRLAEVPPYVRVLAFDERGQTLLRQAKKRGEIRLVNAGQRPPDLPYYAMECRAADLYTLFGAPGTCCCAGMEQKYRIFQKKK